MLPNIERTRFDSFNQWMRKLSLLLALMTALVPVGNVSGAPPDTVRIVSGGDFQYYFNLIRPGVYDLVRVGAGGTFITVSRGTLSYLISLLPASVSGGSVPLITFTAPTALSTPPTVTATAGGTGIVAGTVFFVVGVVVIAGTAVYVQCSPEAQDYLAAFFTDTDVTFQATPVSLTASGPLRLACQCERWACQSISFFLGGDACDTDKPLLPAATLPLVGDCSGLSSLRYPAPGTTPEGFSYDYVRYVACKVAVVPNTGVVVAPPAPVVNPIPAGEGWGNAGINALNPALSTPVPVATMAP